MRRLVVAAVVLVATVAAAADDQSAVNVGRLDEWLAAVRAHEPGAPDAPLSTLADWTNAAIKQLWIDVQVLFMFVHCRDCGAPTVMTLDGRRFGTSYSKPDLLTMRTLAAAIRERPGDENQLVKRGAILHADIVMLADPQGDQHVAPPPVPGQRRSGQSGAAPERVILKGTDGREESLRNGLVHWDIAFALLDRVTDASGKRAPQSDDTVRLWYRAVIAHLQSVAMHDQTHFVRALRLFPTDPDFLFQTACLHESLASPPVQSVVRTATLPPGVDIGVRSERSELETAERLLRQALTQDPTFAEARLRLGRVLARLGRHADAAAELRQLSDDDFDQPENRYFAALFLGAEEEALGRRSEARTAYAHAGDLFPQAQSPQLALSHLARDGGDRAEALARMNRVFELPIDWDERRDPFWIYHFFQGRDLDDRLDELYRPFRHSGPP